MQAAPAHAWEAAASDVLRIQARSSYQQDIKRRYSRVHNTQASLPQLAQAACSSWTRRGCEAPGKHVRRHAGSLADFTNRSGDAPLLRGARTGYCSRRGRWSCAHPAAYSNRIMRTLVAQYCTMPSSTTGRLTARLWPGAQGASVALQGHRGRERRPPHAWHAAAGRAAGCGGRGGAPEEGAVGVDGHGAARGAGPAGDQVHERAARQAAQLEHGAPRRRRHLRRRCVIGGGALLDSVRVGCVTCPTAAPPFAPPLHE
jgi:hypothetical protein